MLGRRAWQLGNQVSRVNRDATLRSMTVALGGDYARQCAFGLSARRTAGADSELLAAYFGAGEQMRRPADRTAPRRAPDAFGPSF